MNTQLQQTYDTAVDVLRLGDVDIRIGMSSSLERREGCVGKVTPRRTCDNRNYYVIKLQTDAPWMTVTLGHELYHVWEYEHDRPADEFQCELFGIQVEEAVGAEPRCSICHRVMAHFEAEESLQGIEFMDKLICDRCFMSAQEV